MSEPFKLKIKLPNAGKSTAEFIAGLATALDDSDHAMVRQLVTAALDGPTLSGTQAHALVAPLLLPGSEYGPADTPFADALCCALEDASAYLHGAGSKKTNVELHGTDNGTADAAAYLLALLQSLSIGGLSAEGKGFTWMAQWACDEHGVLRTVAYEPLEEGRKIDPKADQKLRRAVDRANKAFLQGPLRSLVEALPQGLPTGLIEAVGRDEMLGHGYAELMDRIATFPGCSGQDYRVGIHGQALNSRDLDHQLFITAWNAPGDKQSLELTLRTELPLAAMKKHFSKLLPKSTLAQIGVFEWQASGASMRARLHDSMFELLLVRNA